MQRIPFPGEQAGARERAIVGAQIGRPARGDVAVAVRCQHGLPAVVRTAPMLEDGTPFPTLFYLTCPMAVRACSALEADGRMAALNERLAADAELRAAYADADRRYRAQRDTLAVLPGQTAGGMPGRVKCLHAVVAHEWADGNAVGASVADEVEPRACPGPCVVERDGRATRTPAHPAGGAEGAAT